MNKYQKYDKYIDFIEDYKKAQNASSGSQVDSNANVETKNVTTLSGELYKKDGIGINRDIMYRKISEMYGVDLADEYIRQLESHEIYRHDETHPLYPYCVSITMYPFLCSGLKNLGGLSGAPKHLRSFCGEFVNLVFAIASQFAGAVSTPEFLSYMDYFIRKEYGNDYYLHSDKVVDLSSTNKTIDNVITDCFEQVVHSLNQPAAARNFQSVFWNIAYFDHPYFDGIFENFVFPDGTSMQWNSVSWLQKRFMNWLNDARRKVILTFPVETLNLLDNGKEYVDKEWADYAAEMLAKGHSFFIYRSDSVDSLASCCFDGDQKTLTKSSDGINYMSFRDLYNAPYEKTKRNFTVFHNGSWEKGKVIKLPKRKMYKITTTNNKIIKVTDNHINPTLFGDKATKDLTTNDYLLFNTMSLDTYPNVDKGLDYDDGYLIGMYLGDGSIHIRNDHATPEIHLSLNKEKYEKSITRLSHCLKKLGINKDFSLNTPYNNVYLLCLRDKKANDFIREYVKGNYANEKELNLNCLLQSKEFRKGILDGYYLTDGGNSNRIYSTSQKLIEEIEVVMTSLGICSIIDCTDRTDEKVVIRGQEFNRNYPTYCIRWYDTKNKKSMKDVYKIVNNSMYFKIKSIEPVEYDDSVYCFEMDNQKEPYFTLPNGIISHNCRLRNELQDNTFSFTLGAGGVSTGSKGVITININRLVQNAKRNNVDISNAVREQVKKIHKYLIAWNETLYDSLKAGLLGVYDAGYISLEKQFLTIGINGFVEGAEFLGIPISADSDEYAKYAESILKPIYEENKKARTEKLMFNTEFVPRISGHKVA